MHTYMNLPVVGTGCTFAGSPIVIDALGFSHPEVSHVRTKSTSPIQFIIYKRYLRYSTSILFCDVSPSSISFHQIDVLYLLIMPVVTTDPNPALDQANLHILNFSSLLNGDKSELAKLLSACENYGFFYLDLRDWESGTMLQSLEATWRIMKQWFNKPLEEKLKTETISDAHG